jgi:hypothetical protein
VGIWDWLKGNPEKKYRERFPKPEKPSEAPTQEPEEPTPEPTDEKPEEPTSTPVSEAPKEEPSNLEADETEKLTTEPSSEESEEPMPKPLGEEIESSPEPVTGEPRELAPELLAQEKDKQAPEPAPEEKRGLEASEETDKLSAEVAAEGKEERPVEQPTQEVEETTPELAAEETARARELVPEQLPVERVEREVPSMWKLAFRGRRKKQKEKEAKQETLEKPEKPEEPEKEAKKEKKAKKKKEKESAPDPEFFKYLILPLTLASMLLGLSIMPLFPQPLPTILAFLIAFLTYKMPRIGMPIGGLTLGLGLMYNLAQMNFISMLGSTFMRQAFVFVLLFLFTGLPVVFHSRRAVISINLGIIAAISLFFGQTYFLAIPLIFTAVVLFKKISFLTVVYYVLISVPFQIMQYLNLVMPIERWDWWVEPGTSPPIYVPLTQIFTNVQESMLQFRLYDTSKVVYAISDQLTLNPPEMPHNVLEMISHYFDSLPGIVMFLFMVIGIVSAFVFFTRTFLSKSNISHGERLLPTLSATVGVALFFILAASLQGALAFRVDVNGVQMALATFATLLFTLPAFLIDYTPKRRATVDMIMEKAKDLKAKLLVFEDELDEVKRSLPISTGALEVKTMMVRDRLNEVLGKASMRLEDASEIDKIFGEIDSLGKEIDNLAVELSVAVGEYQIFVNCEFSKWVGMFKDIGVETEIAAKAGFQDADALGDRIDQIKEVLEGGRSLSDEVIKVAEQVYGVIRSFYDPDLPEESQSIAFARKKLDEKATPWIALDALFNAINNWNKQYKVQISKSLGHLRNALVSIAGLNTQTERLQLVLGDDFPRMMANVEKAENVKIDIEKKGLNVVNALTVKDVFQSSLSIARDVLSILNNKLKREEKAILSLAPSEEFSWEKNDALRNRLASAVLMTSESSEVKLGEVLESLPRFLGYVDESIETIAVYNHTEELLLNYPMVERAVENLLREKKRISPEDLPFESKYAQEYLKLFYSQRFREFSFDRANMLLSRKP